MSKSNAVRGYGPLDNFIASLRHNKAKSLIGSDQGDKAILDVGCGPYPHFLEKTAFATKVGIDFSIDANTQYENITIYKFDLDSVELFPFDDDTFDVITMLAVIEHIKPGNVPRLLAESKRILKLNGMLVITTPAPWSDRLLRTMATLNLISSKEIQDHKAVYKHSQLTECLANAGFSKNQISVGYFELMLNVWAVAVKQPIVS